MYANFTHLQLKLTSKVRPEIASLDLRTALILKHPIQKFPYYKSISNQIGIEKDFI